MPTFESRSRNLARLVGCSHAPRGVGWGGGLRLMEERKRFGGEGVSS